MAALVIETERAWQAMGNVSYGSNAAEKKSLVFRRSLYVTEDMKEGDVLTKENLRVIRPGYGLKPKYIDMLLGKIVRQNIKKGTPMRWEFICSSR